MTGCDLTICSVFYDAFTRRCFLMNVKLTERLNDTQKVCWVVADNSNDALSPVTMPENVTVVQGDAPDPSMPASIRGSYHHGNAINLSIQPVTTRWALILDVDFFIILNEWAEAITTHAENNGVSFFGAPWHPRWFNKYRGFPCVHCLLIDLSRVDPVELDFLPDLLAHLPPAARFSPTADTSVRSVRLRTIARNLATMLLLRDRKAIASSHDTGFRLYDRFGNDSRHVAKCLQPVYRPDQQFAGPPHSRGNLNRLLEKLLPERLCYFPKRHDYYSLRGFRDFGAYDADFHSWEEFLWQGRPFGFHLRGYQNRADDAEALAAVRRALASFSPTTH